MTHWACNMNFLPFAKEVTHFFSYICLENEGIIFLGI